MKKLILSAALATAALVCSCSSEQGMITKGNSSEMDSLSYALGANIGYTLNYQMADIPFDFNQIVAGFEGAAFDKSDVTSDEAMQVLQSYFMETRATRAEIVNAKRAEADSIAFANGKDSATVMAERAALPADADMFESEDQRKEVSYAFGVDLGTNIKKAEVPIQTYWIAEALMNINQAKPQMTEDDAMAYLQNYFTVVRPAEMKAASDKKMAEIAKQSGVKKTESGILYRIEKEGDMNVIAKDDRDAVNVNYTGRLVRNNKVFDTSRFADRSAEEQEAMKTQAPDNCIDQPVEFPLNRVIPGWTEGMKLVGKGGRISLWLPAEMAYGERGAGNDIGPNEALFFDVEILDVKPYTEAPAEAE